MLNTNALLVASLLGLFSAAQAQSAEEAQGKGKHGKGEGGGEGALVSDFLERLDGNQDGQVTVAEAEAVGQRLFEKMDGNKDGAVTRQEAEEGSQALRKEEIEARFKTLDTNGDGRLTAEESKLSTRVFQRLDKNKDKSVSREELQGIPQFGLGRNGPVFKNADADGDGKVTRAEATQAILRRFVGVDVNRDGVITQVELEARLGKRANAQGKKKAAARAKD